MVCMISSQVIVTERTLDAVENARIAGRPAWRVSSTLFAHVASDVLLHPLQLPHTGRDQQAAGTCQALTPGPAEAGSQRGEEGLTAAQPDPVADDVLQLYSPMLAGHQVQLVAVCILSRPLELKRANCAGPRGVGLSCSAETCASIKESV
jgi:hypothetical protein